VTGPARRGVIRSAPGPPHPCGGLVHEEPRQRSPRREDEAPRRGWGALELGEHLDDDAAVLGATIPRLVRRDRLVFAVADYVDPVERHLVLLVDVPLHVLGALHAEAIVAFRRSRRVG